ncbi:ankyrin repeat-containing domain protein [Phyllosticta citriasiana]|uniref:ankyrin repeat-containing domain protein n=1 Tax=Phyllosticta citriasiana TaxID=595635 RepID=UPI0030FDCC2F
MDLLSQELNRMYDLVSKNSHGTHNGGDNGFPKAIDGRIRTSKSLQDYPKTYEAFGQGNIDLLRRLLEENPSWLRYRDAEGRGATLNAEDNHLRTPLHYATMTNSTALVRSLLAAGASASMEDEGGQLPAFYAQPNSGFHWLLLWGTTTEARNTHGRTALCEFARLGYTNVVPLLEAGAPVDAITVQRVTPLIAAGTGGNARVITLLLARGASVNYAQENDFTAFGEAASHGHVAVVNALLDRGANAMHGSAFHPLLRATAGGHVAVMRLLLDRGRVNINQRSWQQKTALIEASVMVHRGADLRMRDEFVKSALFWAVVHNDMPLVELLLRRDAEGVLNLRDKLGVSPRGIAVQDGHQHMARFLKGRGAVL